MGQFSTVTERECFGQAMAQRNHSGAAALSARWSGEGDGVSKKTPGGDAKRVGQPSVAAARPAREGVRRDDMPGQVVNRAPLSALLGGEGAGRRAATGRG